MFSSASKVMTVTPTGPSRVVTPLVSLLPGLTIIPTLLLSTGPRTG